MFDSHCHLHDAIVGPAAGAQLERARAAGVSGFLLAGVDPDGWRVEEALAAQHPDVVIAFGVHPQRIAELDDAATDEMVRQLEAAIARNRPAAIGEIGLDGLGERKASLPRQERAFRAQLAIARAHDLPVALHVLHAQERAIACVKQDGLPRAGGVLHSCSASAELVTQWLALGLSISFAGAVADPRAARIHKAALAVPRERLLVETDAPFQTPVAHRPATNEPAFLVAIVDALARIRGEAAAELARYTDENARRLFKVT